MYAICYTNGIGCITVIDALSPGEVSLHLDLSRCLFAAPKFATSTLMTASLKVVTIECIEHDVTCLNKMGFIKTMNLLLTNQPIYFTCNDL